MTIPEEIESLKSRVSQAFSACEEMGASMPEVQTTYTLPDTIRTIQVAPSDYLAYVASDTTQHLSALPSGVSVIGPYAFDGYEFASSQIVIDTPTITSIGAYAFYNNPAITLISISTPFDVGSSAFARCANLSEVKCPELSPGITVFASCNIKSLTLGYINFNTFRQMKLNAAQVTWMSMSKIAGILARTYISSYTGLTYAYFPKVTTVNGGCFSNMTKLQTIWLDGCTSVASSAFKNCTGLRSIYFRASNMKSLKGDVFGGITLANLKIYVPNSLVTYYKNLSGWTSVSTRIFAG